MSAGFTGVSAVSRSVILVRIARAVGGDARRLKEPRRLLQLFRRAEQVRRAADVDPVSQFRPHVADRRNDGRQVDDGGGRDFGDQCVDGRRVGQVGVAHLHVGELVGSLAVAGHVEVGGDDALTVCDQLLDGRRADQAERAGDQYGHVISLDTRTCSRSTMSFALPRMRRPHGPHVPTGPIPCRRLWRYRGDRGRKSHLRYNR